jgi:ankyrin repeat protein
LQDKECRTPLHIALEVDDTETYDSETDDTEAVKLLLQHEADPDIYDNEHCTPLLIALKDGRMDIIKLLLQYKCNPYICDDDNKLPCLVAYQKGHEDIDDLLVNADYPL